MLVFLLRRLISSLVLLAVISVATFALVFSNGDRIARTLLGDYATQEQVQARAAQLGLDQPLVTQLFEWLKKAIVGDLGRSWFTSEPVVQAVANRLIVTLTLVTIAIAVTAVAAVGLGMAAAIRRGWLDSLLQVVSIAGSAVPAFIVAIALVSVFAIQSKVLPATGWVPFSENAAGWAVSLILPVASLVVGTIGATAQQVRSSFIEVSQKDFIRTLRSRGLSEKEVLFRHALRAASPPALTVLSLQFVGLLGGAVIVEQMFALPGLGFLAVQSTTRGDIPIILGVVIATVALVLVVNLVIDLLVGWLNPKVRVA